MYSPEHSKCEVIEVKWYLSLRVLGELVIYLGSILAWLIVCCDAGESVYFWEELMKEIIDREKEREKEESKSLF